MPGETDLLETLERVNPVPDPEVSSTQSEELWASLSARRADDSRHPARPRYRRKAVLVAVALMVLLAVPAIATWLDGAPPLDRTFAVPEQLGLEIYGEAQGLPDGCASSVTFTSTGAPVVGGRCGVYQLTNGEWHQITVESATDLAVDGDGGIWLASNDQPLRRLIGDTVVEMEIASWIVEIDAEGTIWAVDYPLLQDAPGWPPTLVSFSTGSWSQIGGPSVDNNASEGVHDVAVGSDGTVWTLVGEKLARVSGSGFAVAEFGGPDLGSPMFIETGPEGAVWLVVEANEVIHRRGVSDVLAYIVRYDGSSTTSIEVPFAEINDLAVHADGTLWASSSIHGVFSYDGEKWTRYGMAAGLPSNEVGFLEIAPDGSIYAGTTHGLVRIHGIP